MATEYPVDDTSEEFVILDAVKWQVYVLTDTVLKLIDDCQSSTLPDISILSKYSREENIFFVSNLTLNDVNKQIVIHFGDKFFPQEETIAGEREILQIPDIGEIQIEFNSKGFIVINPRTFQELEKIYNKLRIEKIYYMDDEPGIVELLFTLSQVSVCIIF